MDVDISARIALFSGGSCEMGRAPPRLLMNEGVRVAITDQLGGIFW